MRKLTMSMCANRDYLEGYNQAVDDAAKDMDAIRARVAELETALGSLYALVQGESPQLLEDDHHDGIVRSALRLD